MTTTADYVQAASSRINDLGWAFYFAPETVEVGTAHGLDAFRFYVLGRGGVLGDVAPPVVTSAFGYFNPAVIDAIWTSARERTDLSPAECGRLYLECSAEFGRRHLAEVPGLQEFFAAAEKIRDAVDVAGLALYAGTVGQPLAEDAPGRAMQLMTILREFKGSAHLVAVLAVGLDPKIAHGVRRPEMWESFGYGDEPAPEATPELRGTLAEADALTLRLITPAYATLPEPERDSFQTTLDAIAAAVPS